MRVGLIVDSACDIPYWFTRKNGLFVLPVTATIDNREYVDNHDPEITQQFYDSGLLEKGHQAETSPFSAQEIHDLFINEIVDNYDIAICETVTRSRSQVFDNAMLAMNSVMSEYRQLHQDQEGGGNFAMRVVDSKQIFAGQGLLAAHTRKLIDENRLSKNQLRYEVEKFAESIHTVVIPRDLHYIRERARRRGDKSVSGIVAFLSKTLSITPIIFGKGAGGKPVAKTRSFEAAVEKAINYAIGRMEAGILTPNISLSVGMAWPEIHALPGMDRLKRTCEENGVELLLSQMGITSCIYIGPGSFCMAIAAEPHQFADFQ